MYNVRNDWRVAIVGLGGFETEDLREYGLRIFSGLKGKMTEVAGKFV